MRLTAARAADETWLREPGEHEIETSVFCVLTRFGLSSARHLLSTRRQYHSVLSHALEAETPGLLHTAFLVESPSSCLILSIWNDLEAIRRFRTLPFHVEASKNLLPRLSVDPVLGPDVWSTIWRLTSVSNNLQWADFDLRRLLSEYPGTFRANEASSGIL